MSRRLRRKGGFVYWPDIVGRLYGVDAFVRLTEVVLRFLFRFPGTFGTMVLCRVARPFGWACFRFGKFGSKRQGKLVGRTGAGSRQELGSEPVGRTGAWSRQESCSELLRSLHIDGIRIPGLAERGSSAQSRRAIFTRHCPLGPSAVKGPNISRTGGPFAHHGGGYQDEGWLTQVGRAGWSDPSCCRRSTPWMVGGHYPLGQRGGACVLRSQPH